jgi:hypothetical protein
MIDRSIASLDLAAMPSQASAYPRGDAKLRRLVRSTGPAARNAKSPEFSENRSPVLRQQGSLTAGLERIMLVGMLAGYACLGIGFLALAFVR